MRWLVFHCSAPQVPHPGQSTGGRIEPACALSYETVQLPDCLIIAAEVRQGGTVTIEEHTPWAIVLHRVKTNVKRSR